ncbi:putative methylase [Onchocerca flexuosa]|uniref:Methyltransferase HEMK2 n=1 Tax=Onchocerca flexuosa TaxID=387005 RepID=A0A238BM40_9BILA|nr:putative methylase [Onchocerca flexuosa]
MHPTPLYRITDEQKDSVYEPAEDTFLLLDALEKDREALEKLEPNVVVEIGSGSGIVSVFCQQLLRIPVLNLATDMNFRALQCTETTAQLNNVSVEVIQCDLLSALKLSSLIDVLLFNPPYVPTEQEAASDSVRRWAGGPTGRSAVDRLFVQLPEILSPGGFFYVIALHSNDILNMLARNQSTFSSEILLERRCGIEHLFVLKFTKLKQC